MKTITLISVVTGGLLLSACASQEGPSHGLAPEKQPEVSMVRMAHDVKFEADGTLSKAERDLLADFLDRHGAGYGDEFQLDDPSGDVGDIHYATLRRALASHGHELSIAPVPYGATPPEGSVRVVMTRHTLTPPACPDWSLSSVNNWNNAQSSNFGCATKTNLALQVANPRDLLEGNTYAGPEPTSNAKAITTYRTRAFRSTASGGAQGSSGSSGSGSGGSSGSGSSGNK